MSAAKQFPTADVISAFTGTLVGTMGGAHALLDHVTGDQLFTHQLPGASRATSPTAYALWPWLNDCPKPEDVDSSKWLDVLMAWLRQMEDEHGVTLEVPVFTDVEWIKGNALTDLVQMVGAERVAVVVTPEVQA